MRLNNFINEGSIPDTLQGIITYIYDNCQQFLKEWISGFKGRDLDIWYSGRFDYKTSFVKKIRKNRIPLNMDIETHNYLDDYFNKHYGIKGRSNSIFVTGGKLDAQEYGIPFMIFPIGKFKYLWSPYVFDLYLISDIINKYLKDGNESDSKYVKHNLSSYKTNNIKQAIDHEHEIMLNGTSYVGVDPSKHGENVVKWFDVMGNKRPTIETMNTFIQDNI